MDNTPATFSKDLVVARIQSELTTGQSSRKRRAVEKFLLAALGSIPWIGGFLSAAASIKGEEEALHKDTLQTRWLEEHQTKVDLMQRRAQFDSSVFFQAPHCFTDLGGQVYANV